jgi:hypothetical protein
MSDVINTKVIKNYQTAEYGKFVELLDSRYPSVSVVRLSYPDTSSAFPSNSSAGPLSSVEIYPKYGILSHITNFDDLSITLSANDVTIGAVELKDGNSGLRADVVDAGSGLNALRVISQDLESSVDDIAIGDKSGNLASVYAPTSSLQVRVTNTIDTVASSNPVQLDAFGRFRVSQPLTLFDSSHRYRDNNLWSSLTAANATYAFNQNQGLVDLTVSNLSGSSVIRETTKVFSYQPGKSLLVLNTFALAPSATNLRQRTGYFGADNGIYFQMDDATISFVERSLVTGSPSETIVPISAWNIDKLDGNGPSGFTLDVTKAQISWMDIEWLGVGTVRCGFVIDGKFVHCHSFHHANRIASTYITTASLPLRYEITNKANTGVTRTMKQICSTVISEGGYELRGLQQSIGTTITAPKDLATAGTFYPVASIRLKASPNRLDAIVILTALSLMGVGTGIYQWKVFASSSTTGGGAWQSAGPDSAVEYKLDGTAVSGGRTLAEGYFTSNTQGATTIDILKEALFKFQLERDSLTGTPYELCVAVAASTNTEVVHGSMDWEEISR